MWLKDWHMKIKVIASIMGFENIDEVEFNKIDDFFVTIEAEGMSLTLIDPSKLREYSFEIPTYYKELLKLDSEADVLVYNTVILNSDIKKSTINFIAPIIINIKEKLLVQVALDESKYSDFGLAQQIGDYV
jgi:flagellar assembly factor FliW